MPDELSTVALPEEASTARLMALWLALGISFFGSLAFAGALFPRHYEWSRDVISSLASPRDNPRGHYIAVAGLMISGVLLIPFEMVMQKRLAAHSPRVTNWAGRLFMGAAVFLFLAGIAVPGHYHILGIGRAHEHLAQISGIAFGLALIGYMVALVGLPKTGLWLRLTAIALVAIPVGALTTWRLMLVLAYEFSSKENYLAVRSSIGNSLALWEWIGAVGIYLFLGLITFGVKATGQPLDDRRSWPDASV